MYLIGLTGNIASGKSTVCRMLGEFGAETIDADIVAHETMEPSNPAYEQVVETFGEEILHPDGTIDRKRLGGIVFSAPEALQQLEAIVHPAVERRLTQRLRRITRPVVVIEAIKLIEAGLHTRCDAVWIVICEREQRIERLTRQREITRAEAELRMEAQPPIEPKLPLADTVIDNTGTIERTRERVKREWEKIQKELP